MSDYLIRLYTEHKGQLNDLREEYEIDQELCGTIPVVGDLIVSPFRDIPAPEARRNMKYRTIYEVVKRYFQPTSDEKWNYVTLVVKYRRPSDEEADIVTKT